MKRWQTWEGKVDRREIVGKYLPAIAHITKAIVTARVEVTAAHGVKMMRMPAEKGGLSLGEKVETVQRVSVLELGRPYKLLDLMNVVYEYQPREKGMKGTLSVAIPSHRSGI